MMLIWLGWPKFNAYSLAIATTKAHNHLHFDQGEIFSLSSPLHNWDSHEKLWELRKTNASQEKAKKVYEKLEYFDVKLLK